MPTKKTTRKSIKNSKSLATKTDLDFDLPKDGWDLDFKINQEFDLTTRQQEFISTAMDVDNKMCIVDGPAGTSKTYLAVLAALQMLNRREVENIIYIRSIVESASKSMGALPGELADKFAPWSMPLIDKLDEILVGNTSNNLLSKGYIKCIPVNFTRGLTFKNACVIVDESQNMTNSELTTILTRFGIDSKYLMLGDTYQADIGGKSGFSGVFKAFNHTSCIENGINTFRFDSDDIVRSEILKLIVERLHTIQS